jgi:hypothetical protein
MILLGSELPNKAAPLYRESTNGSNILRTSIDVYQTWNKPEKAKQWRAKQTHIEDF